MYFAAPSIDGDLVEIIRRLKLVIFDFDGVFTDNRVWVFENGREAVACSRFDGIGLRALERAGVHPLVLSTETNPVVSKRCLKLKIDCYQGCADKGLELDRLMARYDCDESRTAFVGNDVNDLPCLRRVALPIVVQDAHPAVIPLARYRTSTPGGHGAVREVCDLIAHLRAPDQRPG